MKTFNYVLTKQYKTGMINNKLLEIRKYLGNHGYGVLLALTAPI